MRSTRIKLVMIRALHSSVARSLNYQITRLPTPKFAFVRGNQGWFQLLCSRSGWRRVLRTEAGGLAGVSPAGAEAATMHGRTAGCAASAGEAVGGHSQLPGGNGSRQQNGRYDGCKQRSLANLSDHGSRLLFLEGRMSAGRSGWSTPRKRVSVQSRLNTKARGTVYDPAEAGATALYGCTAAAWAEAGKIGIFSQLQSRNRARGENGGKNGCKQCYFGNLFNHV